MYNRLTKEQLELKYHELRREGWSPRVAIAKLRVGNKQVEAEGRILSIYSCRRDYIDFFLSKKCIPIKNRDSFVANLLFKAWRYQYRAIPKKNKPRTLRYKRIDRDRKKAIKLAAMSSTSSGHIPPVEQLQPEQSNHSNVC